MYMFRFDMDKIRPQYSNPDMAPLLYDLQVHILAAMDMIISEGEYDVTMNPSSDRRLQGHKVRVSLGERDAWPAAIYVSIDDRLAAQYTYMDRAFALRTLDAFATPGDAQDLNL